METKDYENLGQYIIAGFARLVDLGATHTINESNSNSLEDDIFSIIKDSWEEVGENIREAMNTYDRERRR